MKQLEPDDLQKLEKRQIDPTYNARILREKKSVTF